MIVALGTSSGRGEAIAIVNRDRHIAKTFALTSLDAIFGIYSTRAEAVTGLAAGSALGSTEPLR